MGDILEVYKYCFKTFLSVLEKYPEVKCEMTRSYGKSMFSFLWTHHAISHGDYHFSVSIYSTQGFQFLHILDNTRHLVMFLFCLFFFFFDCDCLHGRQYLIVILIGISLVTVEHFFIVFVAHLHIFRVCYLSVLCSQSGNYPDQ